MYLLRGLSVQWTLQVKKITIIFDIIVQNSRNSHLEHSKIV